MSDGIEEKIARIPVVNAMARLLKRVKLPGFEGLSLYDLLEMYIVGIVQGTLSTRASAISFSVFMAIFPLLIFLVTLVFFLIPYVSVGGEQFDIQFLAFLESFLPKATNDYFSQIYDQIEEQKSGGLLSSTFIMSIFLMANGVNAIFAGFENSYHVKLTRNFFRQYGYALMVGLILAILLIVGALAYAYFEFVINYLSDWVAKTNLETNVTENDFITARARSLLFFFLMSYLITAILYYFGTADGRHTRFFSIGALMTSLLFLVTSYLFGIYVEKFARYNELYGTLGALLILMVFIWLNSNILLLGFELNASLRSLKKQYREASRNKY